MPGPREGPHCFSKQHGQPRQQGILRFSRRQPYLAQAWVVCWGRGRCISAGKFWGRLAPATPLRVIHLQMLMCPWLCCSCTGPASCEFAEHGLEFAERGLDFAERGLDFAERGLDFAKYGPESRSL